MVPVLVLLIFISQLTLSYCAECSPGELRTGDSCLSLSKIAPDMPLLEAERVCDNKSAFLPTIKDPQKNGFIIRWLQGEVDQSTTLIMVWINLKRTAYPEDGLSPNITVNRSSSDWRWQNDRSEMDSRDMWCPGEPNGDLRANCAYEYINLTESRGCFDDIGCAGTVDETPTAVICERRLVNDKQNKQTKSTSPSVVVLVLLYVLGICLVIAALYAVLRARRQNSRYHI